MNTILCHWQPSHRQWRHSNVVFGNLGDHFLWPLCKISSVQCLTDWRQSSETKETQFRTNIFLQNCFWPSTCQIWGFLHHLLHHVLEGIHKVFKSTVAQLPVEFFSQKEWYVWNQLPSTVNFSSLACFRRSILKVLILLIILNVIRLFLFYCQWQVYVTMFIFYYGQLLVHCACIMPCCTYLLLVHHICTRLERINDDDIATTHCLEVTRLSRYCAIFGFCNIIEYYSCWWAAICIIFSSNNFIDHTCRTI